jgi:dynein heavy chain
VKLLTEQRALVARKIAHYAGGINKLVETNLVVDRMKKQLVELQPVLQQAAVDTQALLKQVAEDQASAEEVKARVKKEEAEVGVISRDAGEIAADAQRDLDEAMPAFHSAVNALKSLNKSDIQEMKAYKQPPELVQLVLEAVCILLGRKPSWDEAKKLMSDMGFLQSLQDFDKDNIDPKKVKAIQKYVKNDSFQPDTVGKVSKAARSLCLWVRAMDTYDRVAKTVEPKKEKLAAAKAKLLEAESMLGEKQKMLAEVEARVAGLKRTLDETQSKARELAEQEADTQVKLERAAKLVGGLGSEKVRWEGLCRSLQEGQRNLVGNMVVCSGAIAYQGPFTAPYRSKLNKAWVAKVKGLGIACADNPTVGNVLGDPVTVREWGICGLPLDTLSVENAIFVTRSRRWPLMVDPQGQANRWAKNLEKASRLRLVKLSQPDMLRALEQSIRVGVPVMLENVPEELDPALDPVLLKQTYVSQGRTLIRLGDTDVDYDPNFRLYITTKLGNPHYLPEVCIKVTIVNFTVTFEGLEDQLLADVAALERPDLTEKKEALVVQIADGRRTIKELEDKILRMLAESSGNILDDEDLINTLDASKKTSALTEEAVRGAEQTSREIDVAQESYRPVATRGSILYFVVADFTTVDPMYQYSLQYFKSVLASTVRAADKADELAARLPFLIDAITKTMFVMICRGLFEKHKGLFAFMIAASIERQRRAVAPEEWAFFLKPQSPLPEGAPANPAAGWLDDKSWNALLQMEAGVPSLAGLKDSIVANLAAWEAFSTADAPQTEPLPGGWGDRVSPFQALLLLRAFRPEKTAMGSVEYVAKSMGDYFKEAPPFDLLSTYRDSDSRGPIIFVLTSGSDPTQYLLQLAKQQGYRAGENLKLVSLGQGQGPIAERLVAEGLAAGHWVCLQNCHLAASWLPRLDRMVESLREDENVHDSFRLWLTTMPTPKFPVPVLQSSLKLTQEPPKGLKANVNRSYIDMNVSEFESCTKPKPYKKLLFGLIFFNAVIQERRKYGAVGWNIPYQWMTSDLVFAQQNLRLMIDEQPETPLEALNTIISDVIYGGRVTDAQDVRLTRAVLATYMNAGAVDDPKYSYCPQLDDRFRYTPPGEGDIESYRAFIATFPIVDRPEIFGLHQNADISFQQKETGSMLDTIISVQPRTGGGGGGRTPDQIVGEACDDLLARLPSRLDVAAAAGATFGKLEDGSMNPLGIFLTHEVEKFNRLLGAVATMLREMQRALKGLVVMSAQLDAAYANLLFHQVPTPWGEAGKGYPSLKPLGSWSKDMIARFTFMRGWLANGPPASFWISAFFFPQGFFTSALQAHARRYRLPIDMLRFAAQVMPYEGLEDTPAPPDNGTYIHGMVMEGARFEVSTNSMAESRVGELFAPMNVVWLKPEDLNAPRPAGWYDCPFYKTNVRAGTLSTTGHSTNHVCNFLLPSDTVPGHWIRRGAALISMTND